MVQVALVDLITVINDKKALDALRAFVQMKNVNPTVRAHAETLMNDYM